MKKLILDEPIRDSFADYLAKGETILWRGQPQSTHLTFIHEIILFLITNFISFVTTVVSTQRYTLGIVIFLIISTVIVISRIKRIQRMKTTYYAITQKRIFFQFYQKKQKAIHQIHFSNVTNILLDVTPDVIYIGIKNPSQINFDTYNFNLIVEKRHQPTLELIKDMEQVTKLIRQGIKQNN
jgi:hypothetical protein